MALLVLHIVEKVSFQHFKIDLNDIGTFNQIWKWV